MFNSLKTNKNYKSIGRVSLNKYTFKSINKEEKIKCFNVFYNFYNQKNNFFGILKTTQKEKLFTPSRKTEITNRRIFNEVFKTIKISDLICLVLDARDPIGTWNMLLANNINFFKKTLIIVLNKIDLVPTWVTSKWLKIFSKNYLVVAFHCTNKKNFGKNILLKIIKTIKKENNMKQKITIGIIGYPNVGKSALINALKNKLVTKTSHNPGCTKVWQFIKLSKKFFIIDSPGITDKSILSQNIYISRENINCNKKEKNNNFFISLAQKVVGIYSNKIKKTKLFFFKKVFKLKKFGIIDKISSKTVFVNDFLSGTIPWFAPIPFSKAKTIKLYEFPWIMNFSF